MGAAQTLAQFIVDTNYETLPVPVVEAAKVAILDGVANMLAGSTQELATIIGRYVQQSWGASQSTVIGWGFKTNAPSAAFANGVFGHCLDYEIQGFPPTHGTSSCLPSALALGKSETRPARLLSRPILWAGRSRGDCARHRRQARIPPFIRPGWSAPWGEPPPAPRF